MSGTEYTRTPNLQLYKPTYKADGENWGDHINWNADTLDTVLGTGAGGTFLPLSGGHITPGKLYTGADVSWADSTDNNGYMGWMYMLAEIVAGATPGAGGGAITAITRASDYNVPMFGGNPQAYSITAYALADIATGTAECAYFEARTVSTSANAIGIEMDVGNYAGPAPTCNPYQVNNVGCSIGMILAAGGGTPPSGPKWDSSAALVIDHNTTKWGRGLLFGVNAVTGADGTTGTGIAIEMGKGHEVRWTVDTYGTRGGFLRDTTAAGSHSLGLIFGINTISFVTSDNTETTVAQLTSAGDFSPWTIHTGSTITAGGAVTLPADPTSALQAATKQYVDHLGSVGNAPTDGALYGRQSGVWAKALPLAGGALTGALTAVNPVNISGAAGTDRGLYWQTSGSNRWEIACISNAEGGSNAGSDLYINNYTDAGGYLNSPVRIARATGAVTFAGPNGQINIGSETNPNIRGGSGVPSGSQPAGSLYLRNDGVVGSTLYVSRGGGTWNAVAGV